jgi:DNA-binding GntR family transcriptional regulator
MLERRAAPLREQAVIELRNAIVRGELGPGDRLLERELEERLGVSRTVVREALRQLEAERLVRIEPHRGPLVRELTMDEARQLYELRAALEAAAARLAADNADSAHLRNLREAFARIDPTQAISLEQLIAIKNDFYDALIAASGNIIIGETLENVQARISQLRAVTLSHPGRGPEMVSELRAVLDAIERRDGDAAFRLSVEHVRAAQQIALEHLRETHDAALTA